jgi:hypothetical protein
LSPTFEQIAPFDWDGTLAAECSAKNRNAEKTLDFKTPCQQESPPVFSLVGEIKEEAHLTVGFFG